jgi:hypothetical protein
LENQSGTFPGNWKKPALIFPNLGKAHAKFSKAWKKRAVVSQGLEPVASGQGVD